VSTASKLNPIHGDGKRRRALVIEELRGRARCGLDAKTRFAISALVADLAAVQRDSSLTSAQKDQRFRALMRHV
jgi:hypothetical protein